MLIVVKKRVLPGKRLQLKSILLGIIKFYQKYISVLRRPCCKYFPSCSQYGFEAIEKYGAGRGILMTIWRVLRCNPFAYGGVDPVP